MATGPHLRGLSGAALLRCSPMRQATVWLLVVVSALGACRRKSEAVSARRNGVAVPAGPLLPSTARADVSGRPVVTELIVDKARFMTSEPVFARVVYSAPSAPLQLQLQWEGENHLGQDASYRVTFLDPDGTTLPVRDAGPSFGGQSWKQVIAPGKDYRARLLIPAWVEPLRPGRYKMHVETRVVEARIAEAGADAEAEWQPVPVKLELPIEVVADDAAALGAVIDEITKRALAKGEESAHAMEQLRTIRDPRVVKAWGELAEQPDYTRRVEAMDALRSWDDEAALDVKIRVSETRPEDVGEATTNTLREQLAGQVRVSAAQALAASAQPRALDALIEMKDDQVASVRLEVVHGVAKSADPRAVPLLQAFTKDSDPLVRSESTQALSDRRPR